MKKIDFITPHAMGNEMEYLIDVVKSNWIAPLGPYVTRLEKQISDFVGVKYGVAVCSGTAAIHCALLSAGVKKGDKVAVADLTFIASANPISYIGATPVFIDSEMDTGNMSPVAFKIAAEKFDLKAAVIPHFYGMPADMEAIIDVCKEHNIVVIEDATEALGSSVNGKMAGNIGDIGCFSFNGNKIITASSGGMVVTNNEDVAKKSLHLSTQARDSELIYSHDQIGFNYRLSNLCAAIGVAQFETIEKRIELKKQIYERYLNGLHAGIKLMPDIQGRDSNRWISCAVLEKPIALDLISFLKANNIEARTVWYPLHQQKPYQGFDFITEAEDENNANSNYLFAHGICLPSDTKMTEDEQDYVISSINDYLRRRVYE